MTEEKKKEIAERVANRIMNAVFSNWYSNPALKELQKVIEPIIQELLTTTRKEAIDEAVKVCDSIINDPWLPEIQDYIDPVAAKVAKLGLLKLKDK